MKTQYAFAFLALFSVPSFPADDPAMTATECEVWQRELSFAQSVDRHDAKAFAEHVHANATFAAASPHPQRGKAAVLEAWAGIIDGKDVKLEWRPEYVSIGGDGVAISRGPYAFTAKDKEGKTRYGIGHFVSVWMRKNESSPWLVVLDGGGPPPQPATEEEVKKHMATAPASCPRAK
jgi:ketosteroid isomerase-like protein